MHTKISTIVGIEFFTCFFLLLGFWTFFASDRFFHVSTLEIPFFNYRLFTVLVPKSQVQVQSTSGFFDTQISAILAMTATGKQNV